MFMHILYWFIYCFVCVYTHQMCILTAGTSLNEPPENPTYHLAELIWHPCADRILHEMVNIGRSINWKHFQIRPPPRKGRHSHLFGPRKHVRQASTFLLPVPCAAASKRDSVGSKLEACSRFFLFEHGLRVELIWTFQSVGLLGGFYFFVVSLVNKYPPRETPLLCSKERPRIKIDFKSGAFVSTFFWDARFFFDQKNHRCQLQA